eukprot:NODE_57_length_2331_cov_257.542619.p1 GENE.NODE_57_length_2331_cov_257.542619~~NODE_57_length_2331_cov_257.542619.p1  ORF type:complete len:722 (-),score=220.49 NODE_57_length_2331_cov_257.542619:150-2027(-)
MFKARFGTDDVIISDEVQTGAIFFVISGRVRLEIDVGTPDRVSLLGLTGSDWPASEALENTPERQLSFDHGADTEVATWELGPNQIFGNMSVLTGAHQRTNAVALAPTRLLVLPRHEVAALLDTNALVRHQAALQAVAQLRKVAELGQLPDEALADLAPHCQLHRHSRGEVIFRGVVSKDTAIIYVVLGSIKLWFTAGENAGTKRVVRASNLLCLEHINTGEAGTSCTAKACEPTLVFIIPRRLIDDVIRTCPPVNFDFIHPVPPSAASSSTASRPQSAISLPAWAPDGEPCNRPLSATAPLPSYVTVHDLELEDIVTLPGVVDADTASTSAGEESSKPPELTFLSRAGSQHHMYDILTLGQDLGWNEDEDWPEGGHGTLARSSAEARATPRVPPLAIHTEGLVTDDELTAFQQENQAAFPEKLIKKSSWSSSEAATAEPPRLSAKTSKSSIEKSAPTAAGLGKHRALMVWLGILIDAVPESLVIGILINKSASDDPGQFLRTASAALPFVIGVFLSNLPESMSSSGSMKAHGMRATTIVSLWVATTLITAVGAAIGAVLFPPGSVHSAELAISSVEGLAAGAMLTMIAQTMMPEAYEQGGDIVGLASLAGFLCALSVKIIPLGD